MSGGAFNMQYPGSDTRRGRVIDNGNICPTLEASGTEIGVVLPVKELYAKAKALYPNRGIWEHDGELYWVRTLTKREEFRLMDFDDVDFYRCVEIGSSNTRLSQQAGNSIVVAVLEEIFRQLL